jgi:CHAT domain-containing protein
MVLHASNATGTTSSKPLAKIEAAIQIIESLRDKIIGQELRSSYFASVQEYYEFYRDLLMRLHKLKPSAGYDGAALQVSERARARSLLEILAEAQAEIRQGVDSELLELERTQQQQLSTKAVEQLKLLSGRHTKRQAVALAKDISTLELQLQDLQAKIRVKSPSYAALTRPEPLGLVEIQKQVLDGDTMLLEYALGEERSYLWAVTQSTISSFELPKREEIETAALRVYDLLVSGNRPAAGETSEQRSLRLLKKSTIQYPESASILSKMVLEPVASQLGSKRLLVVSEGALQLIPFGALPLPNAGAAAGELQPLALEHEIIYSPSASTLAVLRRELVGRKPAARSVFVLADPVFEKNDDRLQQVISRVETEAGALLGPPGTRKLVKLDMATAMETAGLKLKRLPYTREEAEGISRLVPETESNRAFDFEANRVAITGAEMGQYRFVHLATHGFLNFANPSLSGLVLSLVDKQGASQDGFLLAHEVFNLNLAAELVVLSACETGLGKQVKGEGTVGLTRGFMYAGAPRVVVSLWGIDDKATSELMVRFYRGMLGEKHLRPAAALRAAQIEMWKDTQWKAPFYWAAFQLHGEWK